MNEVINNTQELYKMISESPDGMKHVFIVKGEEIYLYEKNEASKYERLEMFNDPEVQEGYWRGESIWVNALMLKLDHHLPMQSYSGTAIDRYMLESRIKDLLAGTLSPKEIRDWLGITNELNEVRTEVKKTSFHDLLNKVKNQSKGI